VSLFDRRWVPAVLFAALVVAVFADPLFTRRTFVGRDLVPYELPLDRAVHDAWSRGRVPVWWNDISGGRPLLPNPNAGVFYPVRPLLSLVTFPVAMRLYPVLHWILGAWGMLLLLRAIGVSRAGGWTAAVSFAFSGVIVSEVFYTSFHPGATGLPFALWALVRPARRPIGRILPLAAVYGLMLLAGDAFSLALALLASVLWILFEAASGTRRRLAVQLGAGLFAGALLALPQVLATALLAPETRRIVGGVTVAEAIGFTISPWRLAELGIPFPLGPTWSMDLSLDWGTHVFRHFFPTFFVGPIALAGLLAAGRNRAGARFCRWMAASGVGLALLGHVVPAAWGGLASPIPLRYPEKFMLGATFGLAVAAGLAVDALREAPASRRRWILSTAAAFTACALAARMVPEAAGNAVVAAVGADRSLAGAASAALPGALAEAGLAWVATAAAAAFLARPGRGALAGGLLLLTAVPVAANRRIAQTAPEAAVFPPTAFARALERRDPAGRFRAVDESVYRAPSPLDASTPGDLGGTAYYRQSWNYYTPALWDRGLVFNSDLDAGDLSRVESLRRISSVAANQEDSGPFFAALSLRFGTRFRDQAPLPGFAPFGGDAARVWDENPTAQPDIRLAARWTEAAGPLEALGLLPRLPGDAIVVETGRRVSGSARPGRVRVLEQLPERLLLETACPDASWLFVLRGDWSYRTVLVDGHPVAVSPAQIAFAAIPVPAGEHRVEWRENIPGIEVSGWGPVAGVLLLAGIGLRRSV
jgi:hypothetical protein